MSKILGFALIFGPPFTLIIPSMVLLKTFIANTNFIQKEMDKVYIVVSAQPKKWNIF